MAGEAKGTGFGLGTATIMLGPQSALFDLTPAANSIGLAKEAQFQSEVSFTELTQGLHNDTVFSVKTSQKVMSTFQGFEYTARNMQYALGLDGYNMSVSQTVATTLTTAIAATTNGTNALVVASSTGLSVGDYVLISDPTAGEDAIITRRVQAVTNTTNIVVDIPIKQAVAAGSTIAKSNFVAVGSDQQESFLSAYVVGMLADQTPVGLLLPKVRVTKGFSIGFTTKDYSNVPFELTCYKLVPSDPNYAWFAARKRPMAALITPK